MTLALLTLLGLLLGIGFLLLPTRPGALGILIGIALLPLAWGSAGGALILSFILLAILLAQPLFVVLGGVTLLCFRFLAETPPADYGIFAEKMFELTDKNVLLAVPFFIVSGAIMTHGGIAPRLVAVARELTGWLPGGLAIAGVGGCALFGAISGSSPVTVIAIGSMMFPSLVKAGYDERLSIGLLTSAGSLGIVIPPSIPMLVYAIVVSGQTPIDVADLFIAGLGPGLLMCGLLSAYIAIITLWRSNQRGPEFRRMSLGIAAMALPLLLGEVATLVIGTAGRAVGIGILGLLAIYTARRALAHGFWALLLPVVILGGIYTGYFSPTEAAAVSVVYAAVVELVIHRVLRLADLPRIVAESTVMMGALILVLVIAFVFNDFLVEEQVPERAVAWIAEADLSRGVFLATLNVLLLVVGCFMDILSAVLIVAPLVVPMAVALDIDPIHLGLIFIVNLEVGYLTPPLGLNLFVSSTLFRRPLGTVIRSVVPFTALMVAGVLIVTYIPVVALGPGQILDSLRNEQVEPGVENATDGPQNSPDVKSLEDLMNAAGVGMDDVPVDNND